MSRRLGIAVCALALLAGTAQASPADAATPAKAHAGGPTAVIMLYHDTIEDQWQDLTLFPGAGKVHAADAAARRLAPEVVVGDFSTRPNAAFFWSGLGNGGENAAAHIAKEHHGVTLGMLIGRRHIVMPTWDGSQRTELAWSAVSTVYAYQARGVVHVILGPHVRPNAIWYTEFAKLKRNPKVTRVDAIESVNGTETTIYRR